MPRASLKQAKLRQLYRLSVTNSATLLATLNSALDAALAKIEGGRAMTGEAGNGFSGTFEILSDYTPDQAVELVNDLLNTYTVAKTELAAESISSPTDLQIHDRMLLLLKPVKSLANDYSGMCLT